MRRLALAAMSAVLLTMLPGTAAAADERDVMGTEGNLVREEEPRADGIRHVDTEAMIEALVALEVNTYVFPMAGDTVLWEDLGEEFLPAAAEAGIDVWVLVYAPSQSSCCVSRPYEHDYVMWAREIARLSTQHPNLVGWTIDDYASDLATFTPAYVKQLKAAAAESNPSLKFIPTVYYHQFTDEFTADQVPLLDGVIFPFWDDPHRSTSWTWSLSYQLRQLAQRLGDTEIYLMPYAHPLSFSMQKPTVSYVDTLTATGLDHVAAGDIDGVVQYKLPLVARDANWLRPESDNLARTGNGRLSFVVEPDTSTRAGMWCAASRTVRPAAGATELEVSFWHADDRGPGDADRSGYHVKQLLLDGKVVWEQDVAADPEDAWRKVSVDLTDELAGSTSATLQWRLYERRGVSDYVVDASVDDISLTGLSLTDPGVEHAASWTPGLSRSGGPVYCSAQVYHQNYGADLGERLAARYGAGS